MRITRPAGPTVQFDVHFKTRNRGSKHLHLGPGKAAHPTPGRIPRVTKLMALAIRLNDLVRSGQVRDYAEIARLGHVSRARVTQIADFTLLAPDIQEALLDLPPVLRGRDPVTERDLRPIMRVPDWRKQRRLWGDVSRDRHRPRC